MISDKILRDEKLTEVLMTEKEVSKDIGSNTQLNAIQRNPKKIASVLVFCSIIIMVLMLILPETVNNESDFAFIKAQRISLTLLIFIIFFAVCYLLLQNTKVYGDDFSPEKREDRFTKLFGPVP